MWQKLDLKKAKKTPSQKSRQSDRKGTRLALKRSKWQLHRKRYVRDERQEDLIMMFTNRADAGKQLAERLAKIFAAASVKSSDLVVVGLPRGGVPVALEVAKRFRCPLDIIVSKKLPYPGLPEFAIGAVSSKGVIAVSPDVPDDPDWKSYIRDHSKYLLHHTRTLEEKYYQLSGSSPCSLENKTVVIVDDGIATGMTAMAAAETARQRGASKTIIAAPVISKDSYADLSNYCDDIVAVFIPDQFRAVGTFYADFRQCTDKEVESALRSANRVRTLDGPATNYNSREQFSSESKSA